MQRNIYNEINSQFNNRHDVYLPKAPSLPPLKHQDCQVLLTVTAVEQVAGTVYVWLGSASHVTVPLLLTCMYLYSITVPAAKVTVPAQSGFEEVYWLAESATALLLDQSPSAETSPEILTVVP